MIASCLLLLASADPASATEVMARVAANYEAASTARRSFVYHQKIHSSLVRASGDVARREKREYDVVPNDKTTDKNLVSFHGEYRRGKQMIAYSEPGFRYKSVDLDGDLIQDLTEDLTNEKGSRDGIPHSMFPLTADDQRNYDFTRVGDETVDGRPAIHIAFAPRKGAANGSWKGDAWIDAEDLQPVRIATDLAWKVPFAVRAFLGTNLRQTGFSVAFVRVAPGVWFPRTYGSEFRLDLFWSYKRVITLSLESSGFRRTEATSRIEYKDPAI